MCPKNPYHFTTYNKKSPGARQCDRAWINLYDDVCMDNTQNNDKQATLPNFDAIRHLDDDGREYWFARELYPLLGYTTWRRFLEVVGRAKTACVAMKIEPSDHFDNTVKMVELGSGSSREIDDVALSRYACYLIVQNGDPSKPVIAAGQTYFAIQTRRQELADEEAFAKLDEDQKRLVLRREMKEHNKRLSDAAHDAGVVDPKDYAIFQNYGYKGLYGGLGQQDIHARKGLKKSQKILDHMGHEELAANLFRATQTEAKLRREKIVGKTEANQTHYSVGNEVSETIKRLGGTMPEDLPTPEKSIKQLEREEPKRLELLEKSSSDAKRDKSSRLE